MSGDCTWHRLSLRGRNPDGGKRSDTRNICAEDANTHARKGSSTVHNITMRQRALLAADGGSSGTRVRVFRYRSARWPEYVSLVLPEPSSAIEPGLSAYADRPVQAADSLQPLLDFAYEHVRGVAWRGGPAYESHTCLQTRSSPAAKLLPCIATAHRLPCPCLAAAQVPADVWPVTPVRLLATAGLRLLTDQQQSAILAACSSRLAASRFAFELSWAQVIGGELEGLYGWAAVNYITGALQVCLCVGDLAWQRVVRGPRAVKLYAGAVSASPRCQRQQPPPAHPGCVRTGGVRPRAPQPQGGDRPGAAVHGHFGDGRRLHAAHLPAARAREAAGAPRLAAAPTGSVPLGRVCVCVCVKEHKENVAQRQCMRCGKTTVYGCVCVCKYVYVCVCVCGQRERVCVFVRVF